MIALARTPYFALDRARFWVSAFTPALEILYAVRLVADAIAASDDTLTIAPWADARSDGIAAWHIRQSTRG